MHGQPKKADEIPLHFSGNKGGSPEKLPEAEYFLINTLGSRIRAASDRGTLKNASQFSGERMPQKVQNTEGKTVSATTNTYLWANFNTVGPANLFKSPG